MSFFFEAYRDLAPDRGQSGHAPWQTLREYGLAHGFEGHLSTDFIHLMRAMERAEIRGVKARQGTEQQVESGAEAEQVPLTGGACSQCGSEFFGEALKVGRDYLHPACLVAWTDNAQNPYHPDHIPF